MKKIDLFMGCLGNGITAYNKAIDLLKSRFKSAVITLLKALTTVLTIAGILWIIGTAGASDNDIIPLSQIIIQLLQGVLFCVVAYILNFIKLVIE